MFDDVKIKVALDVGTSKIRIVIGAIQANGDVQILGHGESSSKGIRKGIVINVEQTVNSIRLAKNEAETNSQFEINTVSVIVSGNQITTYNSSGAIKIPGGFVTANDIVEVMETATAFALPVNQELIHVFPKEYIVDNNRNIMDPLDLSGIRLESHVYLLACEKTVLSNLTKCIETLNVGVDRLLLQSISAAGSVLTADEKEQGVCLINIGAGTTDVAIFCDGILVYTAILPVAGETVTSDIAKMQRISTPLAETIKINYGACSKTLVDEDEMIELPQANSISKRLSRQTLVQVIEARYEEILEMVQTEIDRSGFGHLVSNIVLTGGGSLIEGIINLSEQTFEVSTRIGIPNIAKGGSPILLKPEYAPILGLLLHNEEDDFLDRKKIEPKKTLLDKWKDMTKKYF